MGAEGDRNLYSCKGFVECGPSPLKKKWKHMWISHPIPFSASYSQSIGKRKVLKHRWCSTERWDLVIWQHLCQMDSHWALLTASRQNRLKNQYHYPYLHEVNKNYRDYANSTIIPHETDSRIPDLSVFKSEIWHRGVQQAKKFSSWHILSSQCYSEAQISNVHRTLQAL